MRPILRRMTHDFPPERAPRRAPITLWRFARTLIEDMHGLFGPPEHIAAAAYIKRELYRQMLTWIGAAEAFIRRLLFVEARALIAAGALTPSRARKHAPRPKRRIELDPAQPQTWRVSFRLLDESRSSRKARPNASATRFKTVRDAWPLALRCEALLRVFNDPYLYARRLARRLAAGRTQMPRPLAPRTLRMVGGHEFWAELDALVATPCADTS